MVTQSTPGVNGESVSDLARLARETVDARYEAENSAGLDGISAEGRTTHQLSDQENVDAVYKQAKAALKQKGTDAGEHSVQLADGLTVEKMGRSQRASYELAQQIAPAVKADVRIYNGGKEWGYYDHKTDTICLNINAKWSGVSMMAFTLSHELVHRAKLGSPAKYQAFADFLVEQYGEQGASVNDMVQEQLQAAEEAGLKMTFEEAFEEVVADACQKMLVDTDAGKRLAEFGAKSEQNKSVVQQFGQWLKELMQKLRRIFRNVEPDSLAAQEFQRFDDNVKQILADMFVDMSVDAGENFRTAEKNTTGEGGVRFMSREDSTRIKQQIDAVSEQLNKMDVVVSVVSDDFAGMRDSDIAKKLEQEFSKFGNRVERQNFGVILLEYKQLNKALNYLKLPGEKAALLTVPRVLKRGIQADFHTKHKDRGVDSYTFAAPVEINGKRGNVGVVVQRVTGTNRFKTLRILLPNGKAFEFVKNNEADSTTGSSSKHQGSEGIPIESASKIIIRNPDGVVKENDSTEKRSSSRSGDVSDRTMLVDLFEQMVTGSDEYRALQNYKKNMDRMLSLEEKVDRLTEEIKRVSFAEGPRNMEHLDNIKQQRKRAVAELNKFDNILLGLEKSGVLRAMIDRNRQMIQQETRDKVREYYRQKNETREAEIRQYYRESRRKAVERHEQTEVRQRIRKDVQRLDSLLNKGTKEKNVKLELKEFAG